MRNLLFVHQVGGDGYLRKVVEHVVAENLNWSHWNEREKGAGSKHTEHVSEVRTGSHPDILDDIGEDFSPFHNAAFQDH